MTAARTMPEIAVTPRNDSKSVAFCSGLPLMNGPTPCAVPHSAIAEITKVTIAAPAASNCIAPQSTNGKTPNANTSAPNNPSRGSSISIALPPAPNNKSANLNSRRGSIDIRLVKVTTKGVMINTPMASPSHQTRQVEAELDQAFTLVRNKMLVPMVALTAVPQNAPRMTNPSTSRSRVREGRNPGSRRRSQAPNSGPTVLAKASPSAATCGTPVKKFTINAPKVRAGQIRYPKSSAAASATPANGQKGETFPLVK